MAEVMWYYAHGGPPQGPVSQADLCALFAASELPLETQVWHEGRAEWAEASTVSDFRDIWGKGFKRPSAGATGHRTLAPIAPDATFAAGPGSPPFARPSHADCAPPSAPAGRPALAVDGYDNQRLAGPRWDDVPQARPWIRYWARTIDVYLAVAAGMVFIAAVPDPGVLLWVFPAGIFVFNAVLVSLFGATAGKALLGISVETQDGERPTITQAMGRELSVHFFGLGAGLPIVSLIAPIVAYQRLMREGSSGWDQSRGLVVRHRRVGVVRPVLALVTVYFALHFGFTTLLGSIDPARFKTGGGLLALAGVQKGMASTGSPSETVELTDPDFSIKPKRKPKLLTLPSDKPAARPTVKPVPAAAKPATPARATTARPMSSSMKPPASTTRPAALAARTATRPATRPVTRPATRPAARPTAAPSTRPAKMQTRPPAKVVFKPAGARAS